MLHALKRLLRRGSLDPAQLTLVFDAPAPAPNTHRTNDQDTFRDALDRSHAAEAFLAELRALGLKRITRLRLTRNRNVMVSFAGGALRVHEGYVGAPDEVRRAIVTFIEGRTRAERRAAQRIIVGYPVRSPRTRPRREHTRPDDLPMAEELARQHAAFNAEHFDGELRPVAIRVSRRMKSRLGHYTAATAGEPAEIAISWRHVRRHGWREALHTLLHEMVHQWQDEQGLAIDHGPRFRAKARAVGIEPFARRPVNAARSA